MKNHKLLSKIFLTLLLILVSATSFAETKWEVATLFFGQYENSEFQESVEENLKELKSIAPSANLSVAVYRESPSQSNRSNLPNFLKSAFKNASSKKMLILYGHGLGPSGMRDVPVAEIKSLLQQIKVKVDVLWFDACFLSNIEFLYELKNSSSFTIASEEAEFTSGLPFEALSELPQQDSASQASLFLAKRFIESYSYLKNGNQAGSVDISSATISVIDNSELDNFVSNFTKVSEIIRSLPASEQTALKNKMVKKFSMDDQSLVDLGHLLIELRAAISDSNYKNELTRLIRLLNIESVAQLKTNPRVRITPPEAGAQMIFGFNEWSNGFKSEYLDFPFFRDIISTKDFLVGPGKVEWPVKKFQTASIIITPFAPGISSFDYYFINAAGTKALTTALSVSRTHDIVETNLIRKTPGAFLQYSAYTQRLGDKAERYTGVNITLFNTVPSLDYYESSFNQMTKWLKL